LIADLKEFNEVINLILDGRLYQAPTLLWKKNENNLLDACRGLIKEGLVDLIDVTGL
jgi:hypothetical protein